MRSMTSTLTHRASAPGPPSPAVRARVKRLPRQLTHSAVDAVESEGEHAVLHQRPDHADAGGAAPVFRWHRVEPDRLRIGAEEAAHPGLARLVVPALDAAALLGDLVGAHAGIADQDGLVCGIVGAQDLHDLDLLDMTPARILPHRVVKAVVEVEM